MKRTLNTNHDGDIQQASLGCSGNTLRGLLREEVKRSKSYWIWEVKGLSTANHSLLEVENHGYIKSCVCGKEA